MFNFTILFIPTVSGAILIHLAENNSLSTGSDPATPSSNPGADPSLLDMSEKDHRNRLSSITKRIDSKALDMQNMHITFEQKLDGSRLDPSDVFLRNQALLYRALLTKSLTEVDGLIAQRTQYL